MGDFAAHVWGHLTLSATAIALALAVGVPAGTLAARVGALRGPALGAFLLVRTVPSLAVLALALPFLGVGWAPSLLALAVLALPPIALNTDLGLRSVAPEVREAARGMGMDERTIRTRVDWPLAAPIVFAGVRTAAVEVVASATLAALIGGGGLGEYILNGLAENDVPLLCEGALAVCVLTLAVQWLLGLAERRLTA